MITSNTASLQESARALRLGLAGGLIGLVSLAADFLFWNSIPGVSVGIFFVLLGGLLFAFGHKTTLGAVALALLAASAVQSGIELCLTNTVVLIALLLIIFGETAFASVSTLWARWSEAAWALLRGPFQWSPLIRACAATRLATAATESVSGPTVGRMIVAAIPPAMLALLFALLLSAGNAVLAEFFSRAINLLDQWLLEISISRTILWLGWLTLGVAFFFPAAPSDKPRWWTRCIPQWQRPDAKVALWQGAGLLVAVNAIFFAANTADAIYLWSDARLPAGVSYSAFVHQGVYSLITAVVLAGGTLALLFQQQETITRSPLLRGLALAWVAQNLILIVGVLRRLELYVVAYQLSELRVYVACFLLLVSTGFLLLAWHIYRGMNLGRLIGANVLSTLALFFILQFCDVGTWVASWNVAQWKANPRRTLDVAYLASLGPRGWPALAEVAQDVPRNLYKLHAESLLHGFAKRELIAAAHRDWRSYQHRRDTRVAWLVRTFPPTP